MKVWLTKYALTDGITEQVVVDASPGDNYVVLKDYRHSLFILGREVFERRDDALADAEKRRQKRIKSLQKQLDAIKALDFDSAEAG